MIRPKPLRGNQPSAAWFGMIENESGGGPRVGHHLLGSVLEGEGEEMGAHIDAQGRFQSDKYPWCHPDKVPLSVHDKDAHPFLWAYAELHRARDPEFADDLQRRLRAVGFEP
jgi:hypothetical protein